MSHAQRRSSDTPFSATFSRSTFILELELTQLKNYHIVVCQELGQRTGYSECSLLKTRSRISMSTHTHITSAAMAIPTLGAAMLIVVHLSLSTPFYHHSQSTFTIVCGAAIPEVFHHVPCFSIVASVNNNFSLGPQVGPMISLLIEFPEDVFHVVINLRDGVGDLPFPQ